MWCWYWYCYIKTEKCFSVPVVREKERVSEGECRISACTLRALCSVVDAKVTTSQIPTNAQQPAHTHTHRLVTESFTCTVIRTELHGIEGTTFTSGFHIAFIASRCHHKHRERESNKSFTQNDISNVLWQQPAFKHISTHNSHKQLSSKTHIPLSIYARLNRFLNGHKPLLGIWFRRWR